MTTVDDILRAMNEAPATAAKPDAVKRVMAKTILAFQVALDAEEITAGMLKDICQGLACTMICNGGIILKNALPDMPGEAIHAVLMLTSDVVKTVQHMAQTGLVSTPITTADYDFRKELRREP